MTINVLLQCPGDALGVRSFLNFWQGFGWRRVDNPSGQGLLFLCLLLSLFWGSFGTVLAQGAGSAGAPGAAVSVPGTPSAQGSKGGAGNMPAVGSAGTGGAGTAVGAGSLGYPINPASGKMLVRLFYPPSSVTIKSLIFMDIINVLKDDLGKYQIVFEEYPWKRAYQMALDGEGGVMTLGKNSERLLVFDYTEEVLMDDVSLVVLRGQEIPFTHINDLQGKVVGVNAGSSYGDEFERGRKTIFQVDEDYGGTAARLRKLLARRVDATIINTGRAGLNAALAQNDELRPQAQELVVLPKPLFLDPNYIGFAKKAQMNGFIQDFNRALSKAKQTGSVQKILDRYYRPIR